MGRRGTLSAEEYLSGYHHTTGLTALLQLSGETGHGEHHTLELKEPSLPVQRMRKGQEAGPRFHAPLAHVHTHTHTPQALDSYSEGHFYLSSPLLPSPSWEITKY